MEQTWKDRAAQAAIAAGLLVVLFAVMAVWTLAGNRHQDRSCTFTSSSGVTYEGPCPNEGPVP